MWVYKYWDPNLWAVGFYTPEGFFILETKHASRESAAARVHYLNGGDQEKGASANEEGI